MIGKLFKAIDQFLLSQERSESTDRSRQDEDQLDVLALEERILYSAVPLVEPAEPAEWNDSTDPNQDADQDWTQSESSGENAGGGAADDSDSDQDGFIQDLTPQSYELIFVDTSVPGYQQLIDDIVSSSDPSRRIELVLIDQNVDGIAQITSELSERSNLDAIHIVSHGESGQVQLGNSLLNESNLAGYAGEIASWSNALSVDADILFYGCDLADADGRDFVDSFAALTGADVAASDDLTGHSDFGGDWVLEYAVGDVQTDVAFSYAVQASWYGTLDITTGLVGHY